MKSALAHHFRQRRAAVNLTVGQLARAVGYRNLRKGAKLIHHFEMTGDVRADLLVKLTAVLGIDETTLRSLVRHDRRIFLSEWKKWAAVPIRGYVVIHLMPAWYTTVGLPEELIDFESAKRFAAAKAVEARRDVCLVWSRRMSVYFDSTGAATAQVRTVPGSDHTPWMRIDGKTFLPGAGMIDWPRRPQWLEPGK